MPEAIDTREGWLDDATERLRPDFIRATTPIPDEVKVSVGFPSRHALGRRRVAAGQCWDAKTTGDRIAQIYISPLMEDPVEVLAVLVHELVHAAIGCKHGHRAPFKRAATRLGLEGKMTATVAGETLLVRLRELADALGPFPHSKLTPTATAATQTTRLLKVACDRCEYIARVTRKMLTMHGPPVCPSCMESMTDGAT
jgi:hypothetical protein